MCLGLDWRRSGVSPKQKMFSSDLSTTATTSKPGVTSTSALNSTESSSLLIRPTTSRNKSPTINNGLLHADWKGNRSWSTGGIGREVRNVLRINQLYGCGGLLCVHVLTEVMSEDGQCSELMFFVCAYCWYIQHKHWSNSTYTCPSFLWVVSTTMSLFCSSWVKGTNQ